MSPVLWGVDSAVVADSEILTCVKRQYGTPEFWGRYLTSVQGSSEGLTRNEVRFLKNNGIKILPIYNNFQSAVGKRNGTVAASNAIFQAKRLGIRRGSVLFANIEKFYDVDANWLIGWVETLYKSGYRAGLFHDPMRGKFNHAYCQAVEQSDLVKTQSILWSAEPEPGVTSKRNAPKFKPKKPPCIANVWAWQYGRNSSTCPVDTVLIEQRLFQFLH